jgi:hypothetical protein
MGYIAVNRLHNRHFSTAEMFFADVLGLMDLVLSGLLPLLPIVGRLDNDIKTSFIIGASDIFLAYI